MRFVYGKQDLRTLERSQEVGFLLTNGLGGYCSAMAGLSVPRCDQGLLVAAVRAPNARIDMVHRLGEVLDIGGEQAALSTQRFADGTPDEEGYRHLSTFVFDGLPVWTYDVRGVRVVRQALMAFGENTTLVRYQLSNRSGQPVRLTVRPFLRFTAREDALAEKKDFVFENGVVRASGYTLYIQTQGTLEKICPQWQTLDYSEDAMDGRPEKGLCCAVCQMTVFLAPGEDRAVVLSFSTRDRAASWEDLLQAHRRRERELLDRAGLSDPVARQLVLAADAYMVRRDSTKGKTIIAGYPLFSDWGRDTMIALPGCALSTGRYEDARSILQTFLAYERDGLVPNLFPEGGAAPMYNTVDAALLLIDALWHYHRRTGDDDLLRQAWPVLERIVEHYQKGTRHAIGMDEDGLIFAGAGLDQVTWMDVCVNGILPTPRHGKPVEINAYWYNALKILEALAPRAGADGSGYGLLAEKVKTSFLEKFYIKEEGYLKDVLSGSDCDRQIRCNQIWAVSMAFSMLDADQARSVVDTVGRHLYTPCGLRTLSPEDPQYHGIYTGPQVRRDMAYHQGTAWVFPLGAYYRAHWKVYRDRAYIQEGLAALEPMLREGCTGHLPEIYDGDFPTRSKGCFGQAWSVGEMLRVFEEMERM